MRKSPFRSPLVPAAGLEPARLAATDFKSVMSTIPSRGLVVGGPYRIRTYDLLLRRQLLYPAELRGRSKNEVQK